MRTDVSHSFFLRSDIPFSSFSMFSDIGQSFPRLHGVAIPNIAFLGDNSSDLKKMTKRKEKRCRLKKKGTRKDPNPRNSGLTPVAHGGSETKAPLLAARPDGRDFGISTSDEGSSFGCYCESLPRISQLMRDIEYFTCWPISARFVSALE